MLRIVAVTGMPGAGKSTASEGLVAKGWKKVVMGDVIRAETRRRGLEPDSKNTGEVMRQLRNEKGESAVADLCMKAILETGSENVVVDGIRSMAEVATFREKATVILVAVHASQGRRFALLKERGRRDDPITREMFLKRDERELRVGIGNAIALADEIISNEHTSPTALSKQMVEIVGRWFKTVDG